MAVNTSNLASALRGSGLTEEQRRLLLLDQIGGPTGMVTAQYGNEAGATFNVDPSNTAGLRAGAIVQDGAGSQWIVGDDYKWAPYTGAEQWQGISAADDARQKLVQDWYDSGRDPANTQAADMEAWLKQQGRLGAVTPRAGGPITRDNIDALRAELDASGGGNRVLSADVRAPSSLRPTGKTGSVGGAAAKPEYREIKGASPGGTTAHQSYLSAYDGGSVTEPWTGTMPTAGSFGYDPAPTYSGSRYDNRRDELLDRLEREKFSYDPATDPVWQSYQKQYRREGQRATEDALGRAAGMTGGVPSSYAVGAATQAGNYYAAQLSDRLPQLYNDAYNRYLKEYERKLGLADTYNGLGQQDYNRYLDTLGQYNTDRNFAYGVYSDDYNRARQQYLDRYQEYLDEQNRRTGERSWAYGVEQDERQRALDEDERAYQRGLDAEQKARQDYLDQVAAAERGAGLGDYSGYRDLGYDTSGLENLDYAYASDGSIYRIGTDKARYFILNAPVGQTMQGGDGSVWEKREDGSVTITKGGKTYIIGGGASEAPTAQAPAAQNGNPAPATAANSAPAPAPAPASNPTTEDDRYDPTPWPNGMKRTKKAAALQADLAYKYAMGTITEKDIDRIVYQAGVNGEIDEDEIPLLVKIYGAVLKEGGA